MQWYMILLICVGVIIALAFVIFVAGKLAKPRFKNVEKYLVKQEEKKENVEPQEAKVDVSIGLNLDGIFKTDEEVYYESNKEEKNLIAEEKPKMKSIQKKETGSSLLEQIRNLSPELKALIFDRGLARKEYDFMSKKDWTSIPFNEVWRVQFF